MRPSDPALIKMLTDSHVELLRGSSPRPARRRLPRRN
jgi:hypothetical protein